MYFFNYKLSEGQTLPKYKIIPILRLRGKYISIKIICRDIPPYFLLSLVVEEFQIISSMYTNNCNLYSKPLPIPSNQLLGDFLKMCN